MTPKCSWCQQPIQVYVQRRTSGQWLTGFCYTCKIIGYDRQINRPRAPSPITLPGTYARARIIDHG